MNLELIQQGIGGLILQNWALQEANRTLQSALGSLMPKETPEPASPPPSAEAAAGEEAPSPPVSSSAG